MLHKLQLMMNGEETIASGATQKSGNNATFRQGAAFSCRTVLMMHRETKSGGSSTTFGSCVELYRQGDQLLLALCDACAGQTGPCARPADLFRHPIYGGARGGPTTYVRALAIMFAKMAQGLDVTQKT